MPASWRQESDCTPHCPPTVVRASHGLERERLDAAMARAAAALGPAGVARQGAAGRAESLDAATAGAPDALTLRGA